MIILVGIQFLEKVGSGAQMDGVHFGQVVLALSTEELVEILTLMNTLWLGQETKDLLLI